MSRDESLITLILGPTYLCLVSTLGYSAVMKQKPISETHPELAAEANGWDPTTITSGSGKKLAWICKLGHEWDAAVYSRAGRNLGCPICSGQKILPGFNDLATIFPEIAKQASGWDPSKVSRASGKKLPWECNFGHKWEAKICNRTGKNQGCPTCSDKRVLVGKNDLRTTHPKIAKEAIGWDPSEFMEGHTSKKNWKCHLGHVWEATIASRAGRNTGCPVCNGKKVEIGFNDLKSHFPELASQASGWDPTTFTLRSGKKLLWQCSFGHTWIESIQNRTRPNKSHYGCPVCSGHKILPGFNDLQTKFPEIAREASGWDPTIISPGNNNKFNWLCGFGHEYSAQVSSRVFKKTGCPVCSNLQVLPGFNDLQTKFPEIANQAFGWDPTTVVPGTEKVKPWKCEKGHVWKAMVYERTGKDKGFGCRICSGRELLIGFNDLATKFPEVAEEAFGWNPSKTLAGHGKKKTWKCHAGHIWNAEVSTRTSSGTGCPSCGKYGFSSAQPGWIYFLEHPVWDMLQIGITNYPDQRLKGHEKIGWEVLEVRGPMDGQLVRDWETSILAMLRNNGADLGNVSVSGNFDGASEAWSRATFEVKGIKELMRLTEDFENENI